MIKREKLTSNVEQRRERDRTRQEQGPKATRYCSELSFRMSKI